MGLTATKLAPGWIPYTNTFNANALGFSGIDLNYLPPALFEPPYCSLESLHCLSKGVTTIPADIVRLTRITALDLGHNAIAAYPDELFTVTTLKKLALASNQLPALPIAVALLTRLETLQLSNNPLHSLPWSLFTLPSLTHMDLRATMLNVVPDQISMLTNLHTLNLSANPISDLPDGLVCLTKLEVLNLALCRMLQRVSPDLARLRALRHLVLSGTGIRAVPLWLVDLARLEALAVDGTPAVAALPRFDISVLRRKVHNHRARTAVRVLWMLAVEKACFVRRIRGVQRTTLGNEPASVSSIEPSYFARVPSDILYKILDHATAGYCDLMMKPPQAREVYELFLHNADMLELCVAFRIPQFPLLFPRLERPDPGFEGCWMFGHRPASMEMNTGALLQRFWELKRSAGYHTAPRRLEEVRSHPLEVLQELKDEGPLFSRVFAVPPALRLLQRTST